MNGFVALPDHRTINLAVVAEITWDPAAPRLIIHYAGAGLAPRTYTGADAVAAHAAIERALGGVDDDDPEPDDEDAGIDDATGATATPVVLPDPAVPCPNCGATLVLVSSSHPCWRCFKCGNVEAVGIAVPATDILSRDTLECLGRAAYESCNYSDVSRPWEKQAGQVRSAHCNMAAAVVKALADSKVTAVPIPSLGRGEPSCPGCGRLRREVDEMTRRLAEMERRVVLRASQPEGAEGRAR